MTNTEFRIALLTLGVSEKEFAEEIDKHPQTVSRWATGGLDVPTLVAKYVDLRVRYDLLLRECDTLREVAAATVVSIRTC